ncbi:MAG: winged helix-turn-helix domain-containing protein [Paraglaciecola sp.]|uniref:winged helix-turn-helix domain-containing protein n=1 Tax=Paraglaciecola sp. TaxID=1920173 RepID=UPI00329A3BFB
MRQIEVLDLIIIPDEYSVSRNGQSIQLPKLSYQLLIYFIENAGQLCTIEQISEAVWGATIVSNDTVVQRITLLRKSLGDDPKKPKYIESIRGRGYRFIQSYLPSKPQRKKTSISLLAFGSALCLVTAFWLQNNYQVANNPLLQTVDYGLVDRGNYYLGIGQSENIERAIDLFRQALDIYPDDHHAQVGLSLALSRSVCRYGQNANRAQEANSLASAAIKSDETYALAQHALAYSWDCLGNLELALKHYLMASELSEDNARSISSAAHLFETKGQLLKAYSFNKQAKALQSDQPLADLQLARIYELLKFTSQAEAAYQKLFILYPDNVFINEAFPRFLFFQGRFNEAKETFEKVMARDIKRHDILLNYATLIWLLEGKDDALSWFKQAAQANPNYSFTTTVLKILEGQFSESQGKSKITEINTRIQKGDTWPINYIEASLLSLWVLKDQQQAIELLHKSVKLGYLNSEYLAISPLFAGLNGLPEFYQIIDNINQQRATLHQTFLAQYPEPFVTAPK